MILTVGAILVGLAVGIYAGNMLLPSKMFGKKKKREVDDEEDTPVRGGDNYDERLAALERDVLKLRKSVKRLK